MFKYLLFFLTFSISFLFSDLKDYKLSSGCYEFDSNKYSAIRSFTDNNISKVLLVNEATLETKIIVKSKLKGIKCTSSRYKNILDFSASKPYPLTNDGIVETKDGIVITTDLCPSSKNGFEDRLYQKLINRFIKPVPVTLFITKRWISKHKQEFEKFKNWQNEKKLNIIWGNHTAYHHYHPKVPLEHNFVLSDEENLTKDIMDNEIELIKNSITPSVFFRFPGLVSDKKSVDIVNKYGLIIVGSNTWLAKGQKLKSNSIILLHGNKNEPIGIDKFFKLIKEGKIEEIKDIKSSL